MGCTLPVTSIATFTGAACAPMQSVNVSQPTLRMFTPTAESMLAPEAQAWNELHHVAPIAQRGKCKAEDSEQRIRARCRATAYPAGLVKVSPCAGQVAGRDNRLRNV